MNSKIAKLTSEQVNKWKIETQNRIEEIKNSPNMQIPKNAVVYYVSPNGADNNDGKSENSAWKTLEKVSGADLKEGDFVCFERNAIFRGQLFAKDGVTYTAYGKGEKPKLYRAAFDAADASLWEKASENIWVMAFNKNDVGTLVFNEGEAHAIKCIIRTEENGDTFNNTTGEPFKDFNDLTTDLHFWHDYQNTGNVYLYSKENPGLRFNSININEKGHIIDFDDGAKDITVDNLCIKYTGSHGLGLGTAINVKVINCEFGWIGGSIQAEAIFGRKYATRYGNGVEIWGGCDGFTVCDNYFYEIYDAAITQQFTASSDDKVSQLNIDYSRNVILNSQYSIEYWLRLKDSTHGKLENFKIEDNYMWYAGKGFAEQRPDKDTAAHLKHWNGGCVPNNCLIKNNLMFGSTYDLVQLNPNMPNVDGSIAMFKFEGNSFVGNHNNLLSQVAFDGKDKVKYDESVLEYMKEYSNGDTFWFED